MKKIIFAGILTAFLGIGTLILTETINQTDFSEIQLANIEALADPEVYIPELVIECSRTGSGKCWRVGTHLKMEGETMYYPCYFTGLQADEC